MYDPKSVRAQQAGGYKVVIDSIDLQVDFVRFRQQIVDSIFNKMKAQSFLVYPMNRLTYQVGARAPQ